MNICGFYLKAKHNRMIMLFQDKEISMIMSYFLPVYLSYINMETYNGDMLIEILPDERAEEHIELLHGIMTPRWKAMTNRTLKKHLKILFEYRGVCLNKLPLEKHEAFEKMWIKLKEEDVL